MSTRTPAILTTSQLLTTGVDVPTCKNVVLARVIGSMKEFKQIIDRGPPVRVVYELDPNGKQLRVVRYTDYAAETVRTLWPTTRELREQWADPVKRSEIIERLQERGVDFDELRDASEQPDADPFDLLCHFAFN